MQDVFLLRSDVRKNASDGKTEPIVGEAITMTTLKPLRAKTPASETLKDWFLVLLLLIFVVLYSLAFAGKRDPFKDNSMLLRFEPIIFVLVGYYFGRLPARHSEKVLHDELERQVQRADAAQQIKEKAQQDGEVLEERIRNARTMLTSRVGQPGKIDKNGIREPLIEDVIKILNS